MSNVGYARVSTTDQDVAIQIAALEAAGCDVIRSEKRSGTSTASREVLKTILAFLRPGDTLTVARIDPLARSIGDLQDIVRGLRAKGVTLKATEQPIDTSNAAGKAFLDMLGIFAEFETNLRLERQMEGIRAAKAKGVYKGRPPTIKPDAIAALKTAGLGATEIARRLRIYRRRSIGCWPEFPAVGQETPFSRHQTDIEPAQFSRLAICLNRRADPGKGLKVTGWGWFYLSTVLDDFPRFIVAWKLCSTMKATDVIETLAVALKASGLEETGHRPRLLSDNGSSYIAADLAAWVEGEGIRHIRSAPNHPMTQGKIDRWHQTLKNRILLENYYLPGDRR